MQPAQMQAATKARSFGSSEQDMPNHTLKAVGES